MLKPILNRIFKKAFTSQPSNGSQNSSPVSVMQKPNEQPQTFPRPKILLMDLPDDVEKKLKAAHFNVRSASFGIPYLTAESALYTLVSYEFSIPNHAEQEIVVIDLTLPEFQKHPSENRTPVEGNTDYWSKNNFGFVDPRVASMDIARPAFDTILANGGIFVVFADDRSVVETVFARHKASKLDIVRSDIDNWSFLSLFGKKIFSTQAVEGEELYLKDDSTEFAKLVAPYLAGARFTCTLEPLNHYFWKGHPQFNRLFDAWQPTILDKFGNAVGGVFFSNEHLKGSVFVFPRINNKGDFLLDFIRDYLPTFMAKLFPYSENKNWTLRDEYQPTSVIMLKDEMVRIREETSERIRLLETEIEEEQEKNRHLLDLLTQSDDSLVKAVVKNLKILGFQNVIDVDEQLEELGIPNNKLEDIHILDEPTTVLVEVKGLAGFPRDDDALQVQKHVPIRMKEWDRTNVKGLTIINHQKSLPALDRDNINVFRELIVTSAFEQDLGLTTTVDLYRLVKSFEVNAWRHEDIKDLFTRSGRLELIPIHYEFVGIVENYWEKISVVGIRIEQGSIALNDRISFELPLEFREIGVTSLQVENTAVENAAVSLLAGVKTDLQKTVLKKGTRVFRIKSETTP